MRSEVKNEEKKKIYESLLKAYNLKDIENITVVSDNSEKLEERLKYIIENNII